MIKEVGDAVSTITKGLSPLPLALIVVNLSFLAVVGFVLWEVSERTAARDTLILELAKACNVGTT